MTTPAIGSRWRKVGTGERAVVVTATREIAVMRHTDSRVFSYVVSIVDGRPCGYEAVEDEGKEGEG